ncbi:hypothetical protein [Breoghania sp. L-A4]|uniref:hypothetical protein n=1 Tax=Breoghania sp. L-A4 TaxID=2304600 RepID=UPI000E3593C4|nr:hypothetical protein [Breoghania sp. L-A4]AXS40343.1 hypothetical protein D1F64_10090 [Breoghania sp. L-A4]
MTTDTIDPASLSDDAFLAAVETTAISPRDFGHFSHVRAAYLLLNATREFAPALQRMSVALKAIAGKAGVPEKYHETITVAFMALVHVRMAGDAHGGDWQAFARSNPDLLNSNPLAGIYTPEQLASPLARRVFILPTQAA